MATPGPPAAGDTITVERTFTPADVRRFVELFGAHEPDHTDSDEDDRLLVPGLLTATLPTEIGGTLEAVAREMAFTFHAPVYAGDTVTCEWRTESVTDHEDHYELTVGVECTARDAELVLTGRIEALVRNHDPDP